MRFVPTATEFVSACPHRLCHASSLYGTGFRYLPDSSTPLRLNTLSLCDSPILKYLIPLVSLLLNISFFTTRFQLHLIPYYSYACTSAPSFTLYILYPLPPPSPSYFHIIFCLIQHLFFALWHLHFHHNPQSLIFYFSHRLPHDHSLSIRPFPSCTFIIFLCVNSLPICPVIHELCDHCWLCINFSDII